MLLVLFLLLEPQLASVNTANQVATVQVAKILEAENKEVSGQIALQSSEQMGIKSAEDSQLSNHDAPEQITHDVPEISGQIPPTNLERTVQLPTKALEMVGQSATCEKGKYLVEKDKSCLACQGSTYTSEKGMTECVFCVGAVNKDHDGCVHLMSILHFGWAFVLLHSGLPFFMALSNPQPKSITALTGLLIFDIGIHIILGIASAAVSEMDHTSAILLIVFGLLGTSIIVGLFLSKKLVTTETSSEAIAEPVTSEDDGIDKDGIGKSKDGTGSAIADVIPPPTATGGEDDKNLLTRNDSDAELQRQPTQFLGSENNGVDGSLATSEGLSGSKRGLDHALEEHQNVKKFQKSGHAKRSHESHMHKK